MKDSEAPALRFSGVTKSFGERKVLDELSFEVPRGQSVALLGRSGTGKSVTLKLAIGLIKPDAGRVEVFGEDVAALDPEQLAEVRCRIGFLFQNSALFDSISVGENVAFPLRRHTELPDAEIREKVATLLGEVGLDGEYDKMPSDLSGGMKKRAGLARALAMDPEILFVDEPSAGLDPITSEEIDNLLVSLGEGEKVTVVVVTHNIPSARRIADELIFLDEGRVLAQGAADALDGSENETVRKFMSSGAGG